MQELDLKGIERKAWTSYFQDGLWDIFMGLLMLGMGIDILIDEIMIYVAILAVAVLLSSVGKKLITVPRLGRVEFGSVRKLKQRKVVVVLTISFIFGIVAMAIPLSGIDLPKPAFAVIVGMWITLVFSLMAFFMDFGRLYIYGLLFAVSFALAVALDNVVPAITFLISAGIAIPIGVFLLIRFLRNFPVLNEEA